MPVTQYIGSRYVPIFADPIEWSSSNTYEPLTIVIHEGNSYTSKQAVPKGIDIANETFWALTGNYNAQVELYRRETAIAKETADAAQNDIDTLLPKSAFSTENTVKAYVDNLAEEVNVLDAEVSDVKSVLPFSSFSSSNTVDAAIQRITDTSYVNYYGADPTGTVDSSAAINAAIAANKGGCIRFVSGTYKISEPIKLVNEVNDGITQRTSVDFCGSTIVPSGDMTAMLIVGYNQNGTQDKSAHTANAYVANGYLQLDSAYEITYGIVCESESCYNYIFQNMSVKGFDISIKLCSIGESTSRPCDIIIDNCTFISGTPYKSGSHGIDARYATDAKVTNTKLQGFQYAFWYFVGTAINCHVLTYGLIGSAEYLNSAAIYPNGGTYIKLYCDSYPAMIDCGGTRNVTTNFYECNMYTYSDELVTYCFARGTVIENFQGVIDVRISLPGESFSFINGSTQLSDKTNPAQWNDFNPYLLSVLTTNEPDVCSLSKNTPTYDVEKNYALGDYVLIGRLACCGAHHTPIEFSINHAEEKQFSSYILEVHNNAVASGYNKGFGNYNGNTELYACTHMKDGIIYVDVYVHFTTAHTNYTLPYISNAINCLNVRPVVWYPTSNYSRPNATPLTEIPAAYAGNIQQLTLAS